MAFELPPIVQVSRRLLVEIEQAATAFPRRHRYGLGEELRGNAREVARLCNRAWRDRARQLHWTEQLVWAIDEMKVSLQLGQQLKVFRSFGQFEDLIRLAEDLGKQAGAWKRKQEQHPKGQSSPAATPPARRAQTLSTRAASASARANP
jgi:hypothetical protein